jgi:hypothetical protein
MSNLEKISILKQINMDFINLNNLSMAEELILLRLHFDLVAVVTAYYNWWINPQNPENTYDLM